MFRRLSEYPDLPTLLMQSGVDDTQIANCDNGFKQAARKTACRTYIALDHTFAHLLARGELHHTGGFD